VTADPAAVFRWPPIRPPCRLRRRTATDRSGSPRNQYRYIPISIDTDRYCPILATRCRKVSV